MKLTISGDPTVTVDGRVAASWRLEREGDVARLSVTPHVELARRARAEIRAEALVAPARFCEADALPGSRSPACSPGRRAGDRASVADGGRPGA